MGRRATGAAAVLLAGALALGGCRGPAAETPSPASRPPDAAAAPAGYAGHFPDDRVIEVSVELPEEDWQAILADPTAEQYYSATVTVDGVTVENAGFRTKGNLTLKTTARSDSERYSFRVKFGKYEKGQTMDGLDEMVLNNNLFDPSYLREALTYEAMRDIGLPGSMTTFANLTINGQAYGLYLCAEAVEDSLLERIFGDAGGNLYKADMGATLLPGSEDSLEHKAGDDEDKTALTALIEALAALPEGEKGDLEERLDVDSFLRYIAANIVLGNEDSYLGRNAQNFYLYERDGRFSIIPWDYNMSFGSGMDAGEASSSGGERGEFPGGQRGEGGARPDGGREDRTPPGGGPSDGMPQGREAPPEDMTPARDALSSAAPREPDSPSAGRGQSEPDNQRGEAPQGGRAGGRGALTEASVEVPLYNIEAAARPLVQKLLAVPEYRARYLDYVTELTEWLENLPARVKRLAGLIRPSVETDPTAFYGIERFEAELTGEGGSATLMGFVDARLKSLRAQLAAPQ